MSYPNSTPQAPDTCYLLLFLCLIQIVHHRPQTPVTFCCLCLAPTSPPQAPDTCYSLLFYVLHQPVHHRPLTPVTFCCFMFCINQSTTGPRHLLPSVVLCLASTSPPQAPDTCYLLLFYVLLPRPFTTRKEKENRPSVRCLWRAKCILITEFRSCVNIQSPGAV